MDEVVSEERDYSFGGVEIGSTSIVGKWRLPDDRA